ncbi:UDP-4-amino-4-deoxy-L-arabinose--oxoglutarate aminotransferase [Austwickia sp. TVS 96-490-7B]|nr:UDP-4-amino-4-deoxy-L-arabinose--oxoglutarate aminotransferase [Austwickia sp. TVS 96-490-7B]
MHFAGFPFRAEDARKVLPSRVKVIADCAHALGSLRDGLQAGREADLSVFSFYANKNLTLAEGGMVVGSDELVRECRTWGRLGITSSAWDRSENRGLSLYDADRGALKCNLSDVHAAIALGQLNRFRSMPARRREIGDHYLDTLVGRFELPVEPNNGDEHSWHFFQLLFKNETERNAGSRALRDAWVRSQLHFLPAHKFQAFRDSDNGNLRITESLGERLMSIPCFSSMTDAEVEHMAQTVGDLL